MDVNKTLTTFWGFGEFGQKCLSWYEFYNKLVGTLGVGRDFGTSWSELWELVGTLVPVGRNFGSWSELWYQLVGT